jgi:hypothetical protein
VDAEDWRGCMTLLHTGEHACRAKPRCLTSLGGKRRGVPRARGLDVAYGEGCFHRGIRVVMELEPNGNTKL